jgi:hypothetical protein
MPILPLQYDGFLPPGLHLAEMDEIEDRFGKSTSRRQNLFIRLRLFAELAQHCGAVRMFVNGSFVTAKAEPEDVDVVIWIGAEYVERLTHDDGEAILLDEIVDRGEPQEVFLVDTEQKWDGWIEFFSQVRGFSGKYKGIVEIKL